MEFKDANAIVLLFIYKLELNNPLYSCKANAPRKGYLPSEVK